MSTICQLRPEQVFGLEIELHQTKTRSCVGVDVVLQEVQAEGLSDDKTLSSGI